MNEKSTYSGPLSQVAGKLDQRSDEVELLVATEYQKPDNCKEMCLLSLPCLGAMPQCIPAWNTRYNVQTQTTTTSSSLRTTTSSLPSAFSECVNILECFASVVYLAVTEHLASVGRLGSNISFTFLFLFNKVSKALYSIASIDLSMTLASNFEWLSLHSGGNTAQPNSDLSPVACSDRRELSQSRLLRSFVMPRITMRGSATPWRSSTGPTSSWRSICSPISTAGSSRTACPYSAQSGPN